MRQLPLRAEISSNLQALKALGSEVGWARTARAAWAALPARLGRDPFAAALGPPSDAREAASRAQIGGAVLLYRRLREQEGRARALEILSAVVRAGTVAFLGHTVGRIDAARFQAMDETGRRAMCAEMAGRFFNATSRIDEVSDRRFVLTVTHCLFPGLCRAAGVEEIAPLFCRGDLDYFNAGGGPVVLRREWTIAEGGATCPFVFHLR